MTDRYRERYKRRKENKFIRNLRKSPINYFSDLFIVVMVLAFLVTIVCMIVMGIYSTIVNKDNSIWSDLGILVAVPVSAGGGIWMIKNSIQHAIANSKGKVAKQDFPDPDGNDIQIMDLDSMDTDSPESEVQG